MKRLDPVCSLAKELIWGNWPLKRMVRHSDGAIIVKHTKCLNTSKTVRKYENAVVSSSQGKWPWETYKKFTNTIKLGPKIPFMLNAVHSRCPINCVMAEYRGNRSGTLSKQAKHQQASLLSFSNYSKTNSASFNIWSNRNLHWQLQWSVIETG